MTSHNVDGYKKLPKTKLQEFYIKALESAKTTAETQKLENSIDMTKIGKQSKPAGKAINYKSKKWVTAKLKLPKVKKTKPVSYK